jgi:hypothetical protein
MPRKPAPPTPLQDNYRACDEACTEAERCAAECEAAVLSARHEREAASAMLVETSASDEATADVLANRERRIAEAEAARDTARDLWRADEYELRDYETRDANGDAMIVSCPADLYDDVRDHWSQGYDDVQETFWVRVYVECDDGTDEIVTVTVEPDEPSCSHGGHDWRAPHEIVGGLEENPGVRGHGAGVIMTRVCMNCGCGRHTDTWAQNREDGTQGHTSVRYEPGEFSAEIEASRED